MPPRVWLLLGHKAGDNAQVLALAEALGWPYHIRRLVYRKTELLSNLLLGPTLAGIQKKRSSPLTAPWPDLILTAGRRNEPVAHWIQAHNTKTTRIVHLGRPWARPERFDLIITTPQYQLPAAPNVLCNSLPLHGISTARLQQAAATWQTRLSHLPHPRLALLVGGNSGPYVLNRKNAAQLGREANRMAAAVGGSLLITSSARTPAAAFAVLHQSIQVPAFVYQWQSEQGDNPYTAYLALADAFIVTGESVSMLTEACMTLKPVYIYDLLHHHPSTLKPESRHAATRRPWWLRLENYRWKPLSHRLAMHLGPRRMRRDVSIMHRHLIATGRAAWLGTNYPVAQPVAALNDLERSLTRIRALFPGDQSAPP